MTGQTQGGGDAGRGEALYAASCAMCHGADATGMAGMHPALTGVVDRREILDRRYAAGELAAEEYRRGRTASMRTTKTERVRERRAQARRRTRQRRWLTAIVTVVAVAVVGALVWLAAPRPRETLAGTPVEEFMHVHGLAVPAWEPETVFLSTHQGLIRLDPDAGEWRYVSEQPHDFMGFSAHPTEDGVLFSSGHPAPGSRLRNPIGFMVSTDGGVTWETRALEGAADFHAMTVGAGGAAVYGWNVAGEAGLLRSGDEGHTWERVSAPALQDAGGATALAAHPDDPEVVLAGTEAGLLRSGDAGASWAPLPGGTPVTAVAFDPADPDRLLAYAPPPGQGLVASVDGGQTWTPTGWTVDGDAVGHLAIHPDDPELVYAGTYGERVLRSRDGGGGWETLARSGIPQGR